MNPRISVGSQVVIRARRGPHQPGARGTLIKDDRSPMPYEVEFPGGSTHWFREYEIERIGSSPIPPRPPAAPRLQVGDHVQTLVSSDDIPAGYFGEVVEDDGSGCPYKVHFNNLDDYSWYDDSEVRKVTKDEVLNNPTEDDMVTLLVSRGGLRAGNQVRIYIVDPYETTHCYGVADENGEDGVSSFTREEIRLDSDRKPLPKPDQELRVGRQVVTLFGVAGIPQGSEGFIEKIERGAYLVRFYGGYSHWYSKEQLELSKQEATPISQPTPPTQPEKETSMSAKPSKSFLNLEFGANYDSRLAISFDGRVAVKRSNGSFASYQDGDLMETLDELTFNADGLIFNMPATREQLNPGDLIKDGERYFFVTAADASGLETIAIDEGMNQSMTNIKNILGISFYTKVVTFASFAGGDQQGFNPMMLMLLGGEGLGGDDTFKTIAMMSVLGGQNGMSGMQGMMANPMMLVALMSKGEKGGTDNLMKIIALSSMMGQFPGAASQPQPKANKSSK